MNSKAIQVAVVIGAALVLGYVAPTFWVQIVAACIAALSFLAAVHTKGQVRVGFCVFGACALAGLLASFYPKLTNSSVQVAEPKVGDIQQKRNVVAIAPPVEIYEPAPAPAHHSSSDLGAISVPEVEERTSPRVGGVDLPDLGDGHPLDAVAVTQEESDFIMNSFYEHETRVLELDGMLERGEITEEEYAERFQESALEMGKGIEDRLGLERTKILAEVMKEYIADLTKAAAEGSI